MKIEKIPETAVLIEGSYEHYIDKEGKVYAYDHRNNHKCEPYIKEQDTKFGYKYVTIPYLDGTTKSVRVHRLVAQTFIPNPENLPIVMHLNNNKSDNRVENLKWGTVSENTRQAYADGLIVNDKSWNDSQSMACSMYDGLTNKLVKHFGSYSEAERETKISKATIAREVKEQYVNIRKRYYFQPYGEGPRDHFIVVQYDMTTDEEIARFLNKSQASTETGINDKTIGDQCKLNRKPNWSKSDCYFKQVLLKGEEIIEI